MYNLMNIEKTRLRSQFIVLSMASALSLYGCGESGTGNGGQSKETASATTGSAAPEQPAEEANTVTSEAAMPEASAPEAPMSEAPAPEAPMSESGAMESQTPETAAMDAASAATAASGSEQVAAATESAAAAPPNGGMIYQTYCAICHKLGMNAAPKYGNKALWKKRIEQGRETMYKHAIEGLRGMPPRGGFSNLTDAEVKAGVDYMVRGSGGWGDS